EDNWMNKSLEKALYEQHDRGITENEWKHLEWAHPGYDRYQCGAHDIGLNHECQYRVKPRTITIELTLEEAVGIVYDTAENHVYDATKSALDKITYAVEHRS